MNRSRLLKVLVPIVLLPVLGLIFLLTTTTGFRLLVSGCDALAGSLFTVEKVEGRLLDSWRLRKIRVRVDGVVDVTLDELRGSWRPELLARGTLQVDRLVGQGLVIRLLEETMDSDDEPLVLPDITFPLHLVLKDVKVEDAKLYFADDPEPYSITSCSLKASVRGDQAEVTQLVLDAPGYGGELQGRVRFASAWPLSLNGSWQVADPGIGNLSGRMEAEGDLDSLEVLVTFKAPAAARVQGTVTDILNDLHWEATGATDHFSLTDIQVDQPVNGTLTVSRASGTATTYGGTLAADIYYKDYPQIRSHAEVQGDYDGLTIATLICIFDGQRLSTSGTISWLDGFAWQGEVQGEQLDPSRFAARWPGKIDALVNTSGHWRPDGLTARLTINQLQGTLRGFPLAGSGSAEVADNEISFTDLKVQSGSSVFQVDGRIGDLFDLHFQAASDDLADLLPESSGRFTLQGKLSGSRAEPALTMNLQGRDFEVQGYGARQLTAKVDADLTSGGKVAADIRASDIKAAAETINSADLQVHGTLEQHSLAMRVDADTGSLQLRLAGGVQEKQWQGNLSKLLLQTGRYGTWTMGKPVSLRLGEHMFDMSELLLSQGKTQIAATGKWRPAGWSLQGSTKQFSLQLLEKWGLLSQPLGGALAASLAASGQGRVPAQAELSLSVPDLALDVPDGGGGHSILHWTGNTMQARLTNGKAQLTAHSQFQDGSTADLEAASADFSFRQPETSSLSGTFKVNIKDIRPLAELSGYMLSGTGRFGGSFALAGTLGVPLFQGKMALADGEIQIPDAGITLQELELSVAGDGMTNRVDLSLISEGSRLTGDGSLSLNPQHEVQADLRIKGKDFQAVNLSEYKISISPDLQLQYRDNGASLKGKVIIDRAEIAPKEFTEFVSASRDVVVEDTEENSQKQNLPLALDVNLVMGPEVKVAVHGVVGELNGSLRIQQEPGRNVTGQGSLNLRNGTFTFRGTTLEIKRGIVFYQGGSLDDPGLDVRAEKKVKDKEVGVRLTGSVSAMDMKLFSSPAMEDSDILAYLVLGREMSPTDDTEGSAFEAAAAALGRGAGNSLLNRMQKKIGLNVRLAGGEKSSDVSLVVGKQIAKDLYISYGKGLTDSEGVFKTRYQMKHGFSVETKTTSEATGADLFWSLER